MSANQFQIRFALFCFALFLALQLIGFAAHAEELDLSKPLVLVANPLFQDPNYFRTVVAVTPAEGGRHVGVIVNRPTKNALSRFFPEHKPSEKVNEPVYYGGPFWRGAIVAVVKSEAKPGQGAIKFADGAYIAFTATTIDKIIEERPNEARYFLGFVGWREGELEHELGRGIWYTLEMPDNFVFSPPNEKLWQELLERIIVRKNGI